MQVIRNADGGVAVKQLDINKLLQSRFNFREEKRTCEKHGEYECLVDTVSGEETPCPLCQLKKEAEQKQAEKQELYLQEILDRVDGLPDKFRYSGFKNFVVTPENKKAFDRVLAFAKQPKNTWLLLLGKNGNGKTHLAHAVLKVTGGVYREFDDIAVECQDAQDGSLAGGLRAVIGKYAKYPMLVIDEVDKVKSTEGRINWLNNILRKRYNNLLPTVLIGNVDLETLCKNIDLNGGEALRDRIKEVGEVIFFNGKSFREKLRDIF